MAPPKKKGNLSDSAKFYRSSAKARAVKKAKDTEVNRRPEQRAKRAELSKINSEHDKKHGKASRNGKDYDHAVGKYVSVETNRGRAEKSRLKK
jgi:hypothetical protein